MAKKKGRWIWLGIIVFIAIGAIFIRNRQIQQAGKGLAVEAIRAEFGEIVVKIPANGTLEEVEKESVFYEGTGKVLAVEAEVGDAVEKGQLLGTVETTEWGNQLEVARLQLEMERLNLEKLRKSREDAIEAVLNSLEEAQENLVRQEALSQVGALPLAELEKLRQGVADLQKEYAAYQENQDLLYFDILRVEKQVQVTQLNLDDLIRQQNKQDGRILSPMTGVVTQVNIKKGEIASPTIPGFVISQTDPLKTNIYVNEYDIAKIRTGQEVEIETDAMMGQLFRGVVDQIAPVATRMATGQSTETVVQVTIEVTEFHEMLKPGFSVKTKIITDQKENTLVLPYDAIINQGDGTKAVYVIEEDLAYLRPVEIGIESDFDVEVVQGLQAGDLVVVRPGAGLTDGALVTVTELP